MPGGNEAARERIASLLTLRDWLRHAVSRFRAAGLSYGHGTATALDEAAFLLLSTLDLPIDSLEPWLDARLLEGERAAIDRIVTARIETRKPAPYLVNAAWIGSYRFYVDERVIVPRSYIGELILADGLVAAVADRAPPTRILDLCTGGGSLAILAAITHPRALVDAVDVSRDALDVAETNVAHYGLADRISIRQSDLFAALGDRRYDLILSNPPYVTDAAIAAFPPEHAAEPRLAHAGGADGLDVVRRILESCVRYMTEDGTIVVEVGQGRAALERAYPKLPFLWLDTAESEGEVFALDARALASRRTGKRRPEPR